MELSLPSPRSTFHDPNNIGAFSNANQERAIEERSFCTLKLIIGSILYSDDMSAVYEACFENDSITVALIKNIFSKIIPANMSSSSSIEIDLGVNGKYKIENNCRGMAIKRCGDNFDNKEVACFVGYQLEHFLSNFIHSNALHLSVAEFVLVPEEITVDGGFLLMPKEEREIRHVSFSSNKINEKVGSEWGISTVCQEDFSDFIELDHDNADAVPDFELENLRHTMQEKQPRLKITGVVGGSISLAVQKFVEFAVGEKACERIGEGSELIFDDLIVYPAIQGEEKAKQFIEQHKNDNKLALIPYGVNKRTFGEDHMVLLAVKNGENVIIDPKRGWFLGDVVPEERIKKLKWQSLSDTTNCGFYVYHMITTAITASLDNRFKLENNRKSFGSNLCAFFKNGPPPQPEEIHDRIRRDLLQSPDESERLSSHGPVRMSI